MNRLVVAAIAGLLFVNAAVAQMLVKPPVGAPTAVSEVPSIPIDGTSPWQIAPGEERNSAPAFVLNLAALIETLDTAPSEKNWGQNIADGVVLTLPTAEGRLERFRVLESSRLRLPQGMQSPKGFIGASIDDPGVLMRCHYAEGRFSATIFRRHHLYTIRRTTDNVYALAEPLAAEGSARTGGIEEVIANPPSITDNPIPFVPTSNGDTVVPMSGWWTISPTYVEVFFGDRQLAADQLNNELEVIDLILRNEIAVAIEQIYVDFGDADPKNLFPFKAPPPYDLDATTFAHQKYVDDQLANWSSPAYHPAEPKPEVDFAMAIALDVALPRIRGNAAFDSVCTAKFASTMTMFPLAVDPGISLVMIHEIAHQLSASHTFSSTQGECNNPNQLEPDFAVEPGSGSTLMAYPGKCGSDDVQPFKDPYFHAVNLIQISNYLKTKTNCLNFKKVPSNNPTPAYQGQLKPQYTIAPATPFVMDMATKAKIPYTSTYTWEQTDTANFTDFGPLFRSFLPTKQGEQRLFPSLPWILQTWETLPTKAGKMQFFQTVRDNGAIDPFFMGSLTGSFNQVSTNLLVSGTPFNITSPTLNTHWVSNIPPQVTWNVGGSAGAPSVEFATVDLINGFWSSAWNQPAIPNNGKSDQMWPCISTVDTPIVFLLRARLDDHVSMWASSEVFTCDGRVIKVDGSTAGWSAKSNGGTAWKMSSGGANLGSGGAGQYLPSTDSQYQSPVLPLGNATAAELLFESTASLGNSDTLTVELLKTSASSWTPLTTVPASSTSTFRQVNLQDCLGLSTCRVRFNLHSTANSPGGFVSITAVKIQAK